VLPEGASLVWLFVSFELSDAALLHPLRNQPLDVPEEVWPYVQRLIADYREAWLAQTDGGEVAALLAFLLLRLVRASHLSSPPPLTKLANPAHRVVQRAVRYIASHLREAGMTVPDIAAAAVVSEGHLQACFRRVLGIPITRYVRQTRAQLACSLLSRTESNVTQIAELCGFASVYSFSRAFRQEIGASPTAYRKHLWESHNRL
jgi:AraC-like DNA-binding protein